MQNYDSISDTNLIRFLRDGDSSVMEYLLEKYKPLVRKKANTLFLFGGDTDDLIQEGMIGLFKAIRDYDESVGAFYPFAELCINRQIYSAIESAARKKHGPLNSYVSLSGGEEQTEGTYPVDLAAANEVNPEKLLIDRENAEDFLAGLAEHLSEMEQAVLDHYLEGLNYHQIAERMGKPDKSIDNAIQRIRRKVQENDFHT
ncbi:MAG: sigma-70 family RNA polymerase sigma factor [Clostridiales bacterium]|nr:sigma-70 family RNA polymerase sigma factor [Clostridiales bacterium]